MISAIVFYGIGNGVAASKRQDSPKIFKPKDLDGEAENVSDSKN
jgi:hypothetical protein